MRLEVAVQEIDLAVQHLGQAGPEEVWAMVEAADLALEAAKRAQRSAGSGLDLRAEGVWPSVLIRRPEGHTFELVGHPDGTVDVYVEVFWQDRLLGLIPVPRSLGDQVAEEVAPAEARAMFDRFVAASTDQLRAWVTDLEGPGPRADAPGRQEDRHAPG